MKRPFRSITTAIALTAVIGLIAFQPAPDSRFASRLVDPHKETIILHWKDANGVIFGNIGALQQQEITQHRTLLFAMNGGMYTTTQAPLGLYIENSRLITTLDTAHTGGGNFHLMPNGVFGITQANTAFVCTTEDFGAQASVKFATQSGPMLLVHGKINAAFKKGSKNLNIRNGVGVLPNGHVVFAISTGPVNFHDFASFFLSKGCTDALYLDGAISRAFIPEAGVEQLDGTLGVLIGISGPMR